MLLEAYIYICMYVALENSIIGCALDYADPLPIGQGA